MSDIVERLRNSTEWAHCKHSMREEAADEITRLRAALKAIADYTAGRDTTARLLRGYARMALGE